MQPCLAHRGSSGLMMKCSDGSGSSIANGAPATPSLLRSLLLPPWLQQAVASAGEAPAANAAESVAAADSVGSGSRLVGLSLKGPRPSANVTAYLQELMCALP